MPRITKSRYDPGARRKTRFVSEKAPIVTFPGRGPNLMTMQVHPSHTQDYGQYLGQTLKYENELYDWFWTQVTNAQMVVVRCVYEREANKGDVFFGFALFPWGPALIAMNPANGMVNNQAPEIDDSPFPNAYNYYLRGYVIADLNTCSWYNIYSQMCDWSRVNKIELQMESAWAASPWEWYTDACAPVLDQYRKGNGLLQVSVYRKTYGDDGSAWPNQEMFTGGRPMDLAMRAFGFTTSTVSLFSALRGFAENYKNSTDPVVPYKPYTSIETVFNTGKQKSELIFNRFYDYDYNYMNTYNTNKYYSYLTNKYYTYNYTYGGGAAYDRITENREWSKQNWPEIVGLATRYIDNVGVFVPDHLDVDYNLSHDLGSQYLGCYVIRMPTSTSEARMYWGEMVISWLKTFLTPGSAAALGLEGVGAREGTGMVDQYGNPTSGGDPGSGGLSPEGASGIVEGIRDTAWAVEDSVRRVMYSIRAVLPRIRAFGRQVSPVPSHAEYSLMMSKFGYPMLGNYRPPLPYGPDSYTQTPGYYAGAVRSYYNKNLLVLSPGQYNGFVDSLSGYLKSWG